MEFICILSKSSTNSTNSPVGPLENIEKIEQLRCIENDIPLLAVIAPHTMNSVDTEADLEFYEIFRLMYFTIQV